MSHLTGNCQSVSSLHCTVYNNILLIHISKFHICLCVCAEGPRAREVKEAFMDPSQQINFCVPGEARD